jgi:VIT1/CCC1 family predicted Fe2+/Mn2+ transporter
MSPSQLETQLQTEVDTAFLYRSIAAVQTDANLQKVLEALAAIEDTHANHFYKELLEGNAKALFPKPSRCARLQLRLGKIFGYNAIISSLASVEKQMASSTVRNKQKSGELVSGFEHNHLRIIEAVSANEALNISGGLLSKLESRHKSVGGNALRAAVLGANDGLVSNMSLVMGVAGAAVKNDTILLTGIAGLLAGAISMALGEWLSVQSSRELHQRQIDLEMSELEASPEEEKKGLSENEAQQLAEKAFVTPESALDILIVEELGIDKEELGGSAWVAAITSFILFALGAIIPLFPFFILTGHQAVLLSLASSVVGLFAIGASITLFTGKSIWFSGMRQILFGLTAAAITFGIGTLIGVQLAG